MLGGLLQLREEAAANRLSIDKTASKNKDLYTVENFISKIMDQCQLVFLRHKSMPPEAYIKDSIFRGLVWEMVELKVCP